MLPLSLPLSSNHARFVVSGDLTLLWYTYVSTPDFVDTSALGEASLV
jgi:hypothetical protein